ncbi:bifunctional DNA primase/polymerase [Streptomyces sp. NRRL S-495]|uniref:bifunctional DNA primase/polymerase n=1 Tax=Streptomyces sp. NRRL S-495 TaxID=1609133 RepID=UPI00069880D2|nr:bifunctional DNA primase/polymerase [Streptomyces sp. NRRL S-495]
MSALDWHDSAHFDRTGERPCRWCGLPTPLRDDRHRPAHKVCAEQQHGTPPASTEGSVASAVPLPESPPREELPVSEHWERALTAALAAAGRGHAVFPLTSHKKPALPSPHPPRTVGQCRAECGRLGHGVHDASTDPAVIRRMFERARWASGYGIACGRDPMHLIGVDLDVKGGLDGVADLRALEAEHGFTVPATATVATPSGGWHLWLATEPGTRVLNSVGKTRGHAPGIDVRGTGGYLVGPGSVGTAGAYLFAAGTDPATVAPAPAALLAALAPAPAPAAVPDPERLREQIHHQDAYTRAVLTREADKVRATTEGGRKNRLWASAAAVGRLVHARALDEQLAHDALLDAALATGLKPAECEYAIRRGFRAAATTSRAA